METTNKKKKVSKKFLTFGIIALFAFALVSAALITNYFTRTSTFQYENPIETTGDLEFSDSIMGAGTLEGSDFTIRNKGNSEIEVEIVDDAGEGIETSYWGNLELTKKEVDFSSDKWNVLSDKINVKYTIVGDSFEYEIEDMPEGFELIYYKDNSDRFNNPAKAIKVSELSENLPYELDGNLETDYCSTGEYATCHGAKLWLVPTDAILEGNELDWSRASEFYFESSLIQFSDGKIVMYPNTELTITPQYEFTNYLETGEHTVTTEVNPVY